MSLLSEKIKNLAGNLREIKIVYLNWGDFIRKQGWKIVVVGFVLLIGYVTLGNTLIVKKKTVLIGTKKLVVEIADNNQRRTQGLSDRGSLCEDCGMLFLFPSTDYHKIWMNKMHFDLDLIWIENYKTVGITPFVPHPDSGQTNLPLYQPPQPVSVVLEVNAGWAAKNGIGVGDLVKY